MFVATVVRSVYETTHKGKKWFVSVTEHIRLFAEIPMDIYNIFTLTDREYLPNIIWDDGITHHDEYLTDKQHHILITYKEKSFENRFELFNVNNGKIIKK